MNAAVSIEITQQQMTRRLIWILAAVDAGVGNANDRPAATRRASIAPTNQLDLSKVADNGLGGALFLALWRHR